MTIQNNNDITKWSACWKATTSAVREEPDEKKLADAWDKRWEKRPEHPGPGIDTEHMKKSARETIGFLEESGFKPEGAKVLDIGCGPGVLSLPLARMGSAVTALDISHTSLERVESAAKNEGLDIKTRVCSWWSADIDTLGFRKEFDLVIASRTPAINDADTLLRMMACSRDLCYYSSFFVMGENTVHRDLLKLINPEGVNSEDRRRQVHNAYTMIFPFIYLYLSGYRPVVRLDETREDRIPLWETNAEQAIRFFSQGNELDDAKKEKIREYFCTGEYNPPRPRTSGGCHGMMTWKVRERS